MARVKFSPIISSIKGKLGNAVFQGGKSGFVLREKVQPRNRNTAKQALSRNRLNQAKSGWQGLNTDQRNTWFAFADFFKKTTRHNSTKILSAYELFMQYNTIRLIHEDFILDTTTFDLFTVDSWELSADLDGVSILEATAVPTPTLTNSIVFVYMSAPFRQSSSIPNSNMRYITSLNNTILSADVTDLYMAIFKRLPSAGEKVKMKAIAISQNSGWNSKPFIQEDTI